MTTTRWPKHDLVVADVLKKVLKAATRPLDIIDRRWDAFRATDMTAYRDGQMPRWSEGRIRHGLKVLRREGLLETIQGADDLGSRYKSYRLRKRRKWSAQVQSKKIEPEVSGFPRAC